jgi:hypothetical protein
MSLLPTQESDGTAHLLGTTDGLTRGAVTRELEHQCTEPDHVPTLGDREWLWLGDP